MYHHSFGLQMPPFEDRIDPALFFPTPEIEEALAALEYECFHGKGALSIIGEAGTGKTLLVRRFLASVRSEDQVVVWTCPCGTETSLLREVCKCFKIGVPASQDPARMLDRLRRHLKKKDAPADARRPAMILDQVENLSPRALTELVDLANLADEAGRLVSLILVGRPRFRDILAGPEFDGLRQLLFGGRTLPPLSRSRTREYVLYRLRFAGSGDRTLFDERALDLVFDLSGGIPRLINEICDAAMLAAYGAGEPVVSAAVLRSLDPLFSTADESLPESPAEFSDATPPTCRTPESASPAVSRPLRDVTPASATRTGDGLTPTATAPVVRPVQWLVESGENLLDRLEEALLRAERFSERAENAFEKHSRAEERIAEQVRRAERLTGRLGAAAEECRTAIRDADARTECAAGDLNRRAADCEQRSAAAARLLTGKISEAAALCGRVEGVERELSARLKTLDARLDELPRAIDRIDEFQRRSDKLASRLTSIHQTADQALSTAEQSAEQLQTRIDAALLHASETVARLESSIDRPVQDAERRMAELVAEISTLEKRAASWQESLNAPADQVKSLEDQSAAIQQRFAHLTQASGKLRQEVETTGAALNDQSKQQQRHQAEVRRAKTTLDELETRKSTLALEAAELQQRFTEFAGDLQRAEAVAATVAGAVSAAQESARTLTEASRNADESVRIARDLALTLNTAQTRVALEVEAANRVCEETAASRKTLEQTHRQLLETATTAETTIHAAGNAATTLQTAVADADRTRDTLTESVNVAAITAQNLESAAQKTERISENLAENRQQTESIGRKLSEILAAAASTTPELQAATAAAAAVLADLQSAESSARHTTKQTAESRRALEESAEQALKKVFAAADSLREALAESETAVARIRQESGNADRFVHRMTELLASLDQSRDRTDQRLALAAEAGDSLTGAIARATELSAAVRQINDAAAAMLERANAMVGCAEQTARSVAEQIGAASAEVWSLSQTAGPLLDRIRESRESVTGLEERFGQTLSRAEDALNQLRETADAAAHRESGLSAGCEQAARLTEDLGEVSRVLAAAGELESRLRGQLEEAHTIADALANVAETTPRNVEMLQELNERGARLVADQTRLQKAADLTLHRLAEQLQDRQHRISDGDRILTEFLERTDRIARQVQELQHQLEETDRAVKTVTRGEASAIVAEAKSQSVQLARVCNAVRKVAASLARQTIDARDQTTQLDQHRRAAAEEIRRLLAETRDAARTLGTWANEGMRVQSRLENVIRECPPLERTHSAASLRRAAQTAQRLEHLTPPPADALEAHAPSDELSLPETPARAAARTDQIARMIEEARAAHSLESLGA